MDAREWAGEPGFLCKETQTPLSEWAVIVIISQVLNIQLFRNQMAVALPFFEKDWIWTSGAGFSVVTRRRHAIKAAVSCWEQEGLCCKDQLIRCQHCWYIGTERIIHLSFARRKVYVVQVHQEEDRREESGAAGGQTTGILQCLKLYCTGNSYQWLKRGILRHRSEAGRIFSSW